MTELSALHVKISGDANGLNAALGTAQKGVEGFRRTAESSAKVFERAFASSEKAVDSLRRAIDPVYASSKRYEGAVEQLNSALKMGTIQQAEYNRLLDQAGAVYLRTSTQAQAMGGRFGVLGTMSDATKNKIQNLGFQVQDVAVQLAAGTRATTVFAQQGSQILSIFGPVGTMLGVLAAVALPLVGAAFAGAGGEVKTFKDTLGELEASTASLKAVTDLYSMKGLQSLKEKYGEVTPAIMRMTEAMREQALFQTQQDAQASVKALVEQYGLLEIALDGASQHTSLALLRISESLGMTIPQVRGLVAAFQELDSAPLEDKPRILSQIRLLLAGATGDTRNWSSAVTEAEAAIRAANAEGARAGGWLATATAGAQNWAAALWGAAAAASAALNPATGEYSPGGMDAAKSATVGGGAYVVQPVGAGAATPKVGGGGGGGGASPYAAEIESLRASLLTKEEAEIASYIKRQEALQAALDQRMITEDEYRSMSEEAQRQHTEKMAEMDVWRYGTALDKAGAFFGSMAAAMQGGNAKMLAISKKFAAAEALINAWQAASQVLKDPTLPFAAKIPAAMKVLAAGMGMVNAIKGGGGGGGGGAGAAGGGGNQGQGQGQGTIGTIVNVALHGANYGETQVRGLIEQINKAIDNGAVLKGVRVV